MNLNPLNWARRRFFNKKAHVDVSSRVLKAEEPWRAPNREGIRDWLFRSKKGRHNRRNRMTAWRITLRQRHADYPVLAHCIIGRCRKLPRYNGMCWTHSAELHGRLHA